MASPGARLDASRTIRVPDVPAHRIATAQHGQRAEAAEPSGGAAEAALRGVQAARGHGIEPPLAA